LIHTTINYSNAQLIHVMCAHLGLLKMDRHKQMNKIAHYIEEHIPLHEPVILAGDFNDWREKATSIFIKKLGFSEAFLNQHGSYARTFPAWAPLLKLDRIYIRHFNISKSHRMLKKPWKFLSDHIALYVDLEIGSLNE
jgi:endonuclease/exonuclease/phosphatase family metal-dependent hydrolase